MWKNIIAPLQIWLLSQGKCVGCGASLARPKGRSHEVMVKCACGRIYMFNPEGQVFRRAKLDEVK